MVRIQPEAPNVGPLTQRLEYPAFNRKVPSSNLGGPTKFVGLYTLEHGAEAMKVIGAYEPSLQLVLPDAGVP